MLLKSKVGLEKEGLRVSKEGVIAKTHHPKVFGSSLTNSVITTDFSESLLELITPPLAPDMALDFLANTQQFMYRHLPNGEFFWHSSMPCIIRDRTSIPLAQYGKSNLGQLKTLYRRGLGVRYGRTMQTIAGIHFNFSYHHRFWQAYQTLLKDKQGLQDFINWHYMALVRNLLRFNWLIIYLFGASPAVCRSFLYNYHRHSLVDFTKNSLYEPFAISLRMGDIGYQNSQEDEIGIKANYNSLDHYTSSLLLAIQTPCERWQKFSKKISGKHQQLNVNLLQIENEYYASVRPKPKQSLNLGPIEALNKYGIDYIELRCLDVNPLLPLGIDRQQILFLEAFFLFCLLNPSAPIASYEQVEIDNNINLIAHRGADTKLKLQRQQTEISVKTWGLELIDQIAKCAQLLGKDYVLAIKAISSRINDYKLTPAYKIIAQIQQNNESFFAFSKRLSQQYQRHHLQQTNNDDFNKYLGDVNEQSIKAQYRIEQNDKLDFDKYLANFNNNIMQL